MKKILGAIMVGLFLSVASVAAEYLTCDPQDAGSVTKYKVKLDGKTFEAGIEKVGETQVRLYYNLDGLVDGKYVVAAAAGNDRGAWSVWSDVLEFCLGAPTPQNIGLYCMSKPKRISQKDWKIYHVSSEAVKHGHVAKLAIDGDKSTQWHSLWTIDGVAQRHPHEIQIDLGSTYNICGFQYLPRQDKSWNGGIKKYIFCVSENGLDWKEVLSGELAKTKDEQSVEFDQHSARYVSMVALSEINGNEWTAIAELNVLGR